MSYNAKSDLLAVVSEGNNFNGQNLQTSLKDAALTSSSCWGISYHAVWLGQILLHQLSRTVCYRAPGIQGRWARNASYPYCKLYVKVILGKGIHGI